MKRYFVSAVCCFLCLSFASPVQAEGFWSKLKGLFQGKPDQVEQHAEPIMVKQTPYLKGSDLEAVQSILQRSETDRSMSMPFAASVEPTPQLRWHGVKGSEAWTKAIMAGLATEGYVLSSMVPRDIKAWCPAYPDADRAQRDLFWAGLLSTLAKHESTYRPTAVGGGGKWYGLVQILPATARGYGCRAQTRAALKDGALNMRCAIRIMAVTVPRDGVVAENWDGVAADWGPFHSKRKREDMRTWVRQQPYCRTSGALAEQRPVQRRG